MDLQAGEHVLFSGHPSWRSTLGFYLKGLVLALVAGAIGVLAASTGIGVAVFAAVFAIVLFVGLLKRLATDYSITNRRLQIRRGIIAKHVQEARLDRVQNVNTNQGVLERIFQVGTVDFDTAGSGDSDFAFRGVAQPEHVMAAVDQAQREFATAGGSPAAATPPVD